MEVLSRICSVVSGRVAHRLFVSQLSPLTTISSKLFISLYPETKGPTLEELADLFERDDPLTGGKLKGKSFDDDEAADTEELSMYKKPATYVESAELKR
jgi:hypothetical protein